MPDPTFTAPPTAPSRSDAPATFVSRADAFVAWFSTLYTELVAFVTWLNTTIADATANLTALVSAAGFSGTSTTSNSIGTGSKTFTTQTGKAWVVGSRIVAADTGAPSTNYMAGTVTAYNSGTGALTATFDFTQGSGTLTAWTLSLSGPPGVTIAKASPAEIRDGDEDTKFVTAKGLMDAAAFVQISAGGSYTLDLSTGINFEITLTSNMTFAVPSNLEDGASGILTFLQQSSGGTYNRTLAFNAAIRKPGAAPTMPTGLGAQARFGYIVRGSTFEITGMETVL
jgi:hypothetical protein